MTKQTVYYTEALSPITKGSRVNVAAYSHYRLGRVRPDEFLHTSKVVSVGEDGTTFETQNSIYVLREPVDSNDEPLAEVPMSMRA